MQAFEFFSPIRVIFGRGKFAAVGDLAASLGRRALVVFNGADHIGPFQDLLRRSDVEPVVCRQRGEPTVAHVDAAAEMARRSDCDCVIGFGGGSAIDAAKAVAAMITSGGSAVDYMEVVGRGMKITRPSAPWMAIPTTAGTGAEATRNAVIGLPDRNFKASIRSEFLLPRIALIDPELGINVPASVTAASGMDALCQLIESYTSTGASPITDALAIRGIPLAAQALPRAFLDGSNLEAREQMALAALLSGMTLTSAGLGAVHGFAAPLGANFPVPHGVVCAALLPHTLAASIAALRAASASGMRTLERYAAIGRLMSPQADLSQSQALRACMEIPARLVQELRIPPLRQFGLSQQRTPELVALARKASSMKFNPVVLSDDALAGALNAAIDGVSPADVVV
jgi:alcohol dehydrogenase class IV